MSLFMLTLSTFLYSQKNYLPWREVVENCSYDNSSVEGTSIVCSGLSKWGEIWFGKTMEGTASLPINLKQGTYYFVFKAKGIGQKNIPAASKIMTDKETVTVERINYKKLSQNYQEYVAKFTLTQSCSVLAFCVKVNELQYGDGDSRNSITIKDVMISDRKGEYVDVSDLDALKYKMKVLELSSATSSVVEKSFSNNKILVRKNTVYSNTTFSDMTIDVDAESVSFLNCKFVNTRIILVANNAVLRDCDGNNVSIHVEAKGTNSESLDYSHSARFLADNCTFRSGSINESNEEVIHLVWLGWDGTARISNCSFYQCYDSKVAKSSDIIDGYSSCNISIKDCFFYKDFVSGSEDRMFINIKSHQFRPGTMTDTETWGNTDRIGPKYNTIVSGCSFVYNNVNNKNNQPVSLCGFSNFCSEPKSSVLYPRCNCMFVNNVAKVTGTSVIGVETYCIGRNIIISNNEIKSDQDIVLYSLDPYSSPSHGYYAKNVIVSTNIIDAGGAARLLSIKKEDKFEYNKSTFLFNGNIVSGEKGSISAYNKSIQTVDNLFK